MPNEDVLGAGRRPFAVVENSPRCKHCGYPQDKHGGRPVLRTVASTADLIAKTKHRSFASSLADCPGFAPEDE